MNLCCWSDPKVVDEKMGSNQTVVCVKQVKHEMPEDEWNESMPLPGDIIEGVADEDAEHSFFSAKAKSELSSQLGRLNRHSQEIWVKVRRGESTLKLRAMVVPDRCAKLHRRFTIRAAMDERHVALLGDLTLNECTQLQEMSRRVVDTEGFQKKGVKYDWKKKVGSYLPDHRSPVISSVLFMPFLEEHGIQGITARSMAWFSAAVTSGVPLVFVNIQTEHIFSSERFVPLGGGAQTSRREMSWGWQQSSSNTTIHILRGVRLWFLPGLAELPFILTPLAGETRFGMDIKRTDEGFIFIYSVANGSAADRAGLGQACEQANGSRHLVVIARLEGKSLMPSTVSSGGLIHCCDHNDVKHTMANAIDQMDGIQLHIMVWPSLKGSLHPLTQAVGLTTLRPPEATLGRTTSYNQLDEGHFS